MCLGSVSSDEISGNKKNKDNTVGIAVGVSIACVAVVALAVLAYVKRGCIFSIKRKREKEKNREKRKRERMRENERKWETSVLFIILLIHFSYQIEAWVSESSIRN